MVANGKQITVGSFLDPRPDDAVFLSLDAALETARKISLADDNYAVAVWVGTALSRVMLRGFELEPVKWSR